MGDRFVRGEDLEALVRSEGRTWPPPFPGRPDPLAPPRVSPAVPAQGHHDPVRCQCRETVCSCRPCPNPADQEDLLCPRCRHSVFAVADPATGEIGQEMGRALHCHPIAADPG